PSSPASAPSLIRPRRSCLRAASAGSRGTPSQHVESRPSWLGRVPAPAHVPGGRRRRHRPSLIGFGYIDEYKFSCRSSRSRSPSLVLKFSRMFFFQSGAGLIVRSPRFKGSPNPIGAPISVVYTLSSLRSDDEIQVLP